MLVRAKPEQNQRKSKREKRAETRVQMEGSSKWPPSATTTIHLNQAKSPQQLHKPQIVHTRAKIIAVRSHQQQESQEKVHVTVTMEIKRCK